jgi:hypothetical protein
MAANTLAANGEPVMTMAIQTEPHTAISLRVATAVVDKPGERERARTSEVCRVARRSRVAEMARSRDSFRR